MIDSHFHTLLTNFNSDRREVLWNVVQPGDPYDIKRSMIAKLPRDKKIFMGNNIELVCLLQAAEIQRISQFLQDHKFKFREIQRNILDRHSYEIQIKELTQEIDQYQRQNGKLKQFIKMQGAQIQDLHKNNRSNPNIDENFKRIYEENNLKIEQLISQNNLLIQINQEYRFHQQNFIAKLQAFQRAKNKQIQDLKLNYAQYSQQNIENTLNIHKFQSQGQIRRLQFQLKKIKEFNDQKNNELIKLQKVNEEYLKQLHSYKGKGQLVNSLQQTIKELKNKLKFATTQMDKKTISLVQLSSKYQQSQSKVRDFSTKLKIFDQQIIKLKQRLKISDNQVIRQVQIISQLENQKTFTTNHNSYLQYQQKLREIIKENQVLKFNLASEVNASQNYKGQLQKIYLENRKYKLIQRQNIQMKESLVQKDLLKRKTIELQNSLNIVNQQLQRISKENQTKNIQIENYRIMSYEYEKLKLKNKEVQFSLINKYQGQLTMLKIDYQHRIEFLTKTQGNQFQSKTQNYQKQTERFRQLLKNKTDQSERYKTRLYQLQNYIKKTEIQTTNIIKNIQNNFIAIKKENDQLYLRTRKLQQNQRQINNKTNNLEKQNERLISLTKIRQEELFSIKNKLGEAEGYIQKYQLDVNRKIVSYEQNIGTIRLQNEELRKKTNDFISQSNNKLHQSNRQINTLNINIKNTYDEKNQLQFKLKHLTQENEKNKQNLQNLYRQNQQLRRKIQQAQIKHMNFFNQTTFNSKIQIQENQQLKKQFSDYKISISQYQAQVNKKISNNQQNISLMSKQNQNLRRKRKQYEVQLNNTKQQLNSISNNHKILISQYDKLRKYQQQYQMSIKHTFQGQVNNKYANYQQNMLVLRNQNQSHKKKITQLNSKILQQGQQFQKIDLLLKNSSLQHQNLRKQLLSKDNSFTSFENESKNRIISYQSNLQSLNRAYQEVKTALNNNILLLNKKSEAYNQLDQKYRLQSIQYQNLQRNHANLQNSFKNIMQGQVSKRYNNYQENIKKIQQERNAISKQFDSQNKQSQKILASLNQKTSQAQALKRKIENYQISIAAYEAQVNKRFVTYEQNLFVMMKQREEMVYKFQQENILKNKTIFQLQKMSEQIQKQKQQLINKPQQLNNSQRQIDIQSRLLIGNKQIQRLNGVLKIKQQQVNKAQLQNANKSNQIQAYKAKCSQLQQRFTQTYQLQVVKRCNQYEQTINQYTKIINQAQNRYRELLKENQRLNSLAQSKVDQLSQLHTINHNILSQFDQFKIKTRENQENLIEKISILQKQSQYLKQIKNNQPINDQELKKLLVEAQNKQKIYEQQIERLKQTIETKSNQIYKIQSLLGNKKQQYLQIQNQIRSKQILQQKLNALSKQNDQSRKKLMQLNDNSRAIAQRQNRILVISQENQRLNIVLQKQFQQNKQLEIFNHNLLVQIEQLKNTAPELSQFSRNILEYQQKINSTIKQNQKLQNDLKNQSSNLVNSELKMKNVAQQNSELRRQLDEIEINWAKKYEFDLNRNTKSFQQNLIIISRERDQLLKKRSQYQSKVAILMQEIQRLNQTIKIANQQLQKSVLQTQNLKQYSHKKIQHSQSQLNNWQSNYKIISNQYENSKKHLQQYELNLKRLYQQFQRLQIMINDLKRQRHALFDKNHALSQQIDRLRAENKDLQMQVKDVRLRLSDQSSLQKRINQHMALMVVLFAQIESLRKRVTDKEKEVQDVRRRSLSPNIL